MCVQRQQDYTLRTRIVHDLNTSQESAWSAPEPGIEPGLHIYREVKKDI